MVDYSIEDYLDWRAAETITIQPDGWKTLTIKYLDHSPYLFWKINNIDKHFRSLTKDAVENGIERFLCLNLENLKSIIEYNLSSMSAERQEFYKNNIIGLFK